MGNEQANVERFNALANEWDARPERVLMGQKVARAIRNAIAPTGTERALEFGAGTGLGTLLIAPKVAHVTALDGSAGMLAALRAKCERKGLANVEIIEGSVPARLPDGPFDLIYSAMTLHHVEDVPGLLKLLAARLNPGGRVALADLDSEDGSFHGAAAGVAHHGFDRKAFEGWLRDAGFSDITLSTAFTVQREDEDGSRHEYPIFLAVGTKAAG